MRSSVVEDESRLPERSGGRPTPLNVTSQPLKKHLRRSPDTIASIEEIADHAPDSSFEGEEALTRAAAHISAMSRLTSAFS